MATHVTFNMLTDLSSIRHLTKSTQRIVVEDRMAMYRRAALYFAGYLNALAGVTRLPDDVLIEVFSYLRRSAGDERHVVAVRQVCQRWRTVTLGSPVLMARARVIPLRREQATQTDILPFVLPRSSASPLTSPSPSRSSKLSEVVPNPSHHAERSPPPSSTIPSRSASSSIASSRPLPAEHVHSERQSSAVCQTVSTSNTLPHLCDSMSRSHYARISHADLSSQIPYAHPMLSNPHDLTRSYASLCSSLPQPLPSITIPDLSHSLNDASTSPLGSAIQHIPPQTSDYVKTSSTTQLPGSDDADWLASMVPILTLSERDHGRKIASTDAELPPLNLSFLKPSRRDTNFRVPGPESIRVALSPDRWDTPSQSSSAPSRPVVSPKRKSFILEEDDEDHAQPRGKRSCYMAAPCRTAFTSAVECLNLVNEGGLDGSTSTLFAPSSASSSPSGSPKRKSSILEDNDEVDSQPSGKRSCCTAAPDYTACPAAEQFSLIDEDVTMVNINDGIPPSPNPVKSTKHLPKPRKVLFAQKRMLRRLRIATRRSHRFRRTDNVDEDIIMIDLTTSLVFWPSKRTRDDDEPPLPPPKKRKRWTQRKSRQRRRNCRRKNAGKELWAKRRQASHRRDQAFLNELIADACAERSFTHYTYRTTHVDPDPVPLHEKIQRMRDLDEQEARKPQRPQVGQDAPPQRPRGKSIADQQDAGSERRRALRKYRGDSSTAHGPWTSQRAAERYHTISKLFDAARFSSQDPITFEDIPWPVLLRPGTYGPADIEWSTIEGFFATLKAETGCPDYRRLVEQSHRRFHPDRWRARRVWEGMKDHKMKDTLEATVNIVSQALTPIWSDAKS